MGFLYFPNQTFLFLVFSVHRLNYTIIDHFRDVIAYKQNFFIITMTKFSGSKTGIHGQTEDMWPLPSQGTCSQCRFLLQNPFQVNRRQLFQKVFTFSHDYIINTLHGSFVFSMEALSSSMSFHIVPLVYTRAPNSQWNTFHWESHMKLFQIGCTTKMSPKFSLQLSLFNLSSICLDYCQSLLTGCCPSPSSPTRLPNSMLFPSLDLGSFLSHSPHISAEQANALYHFTFCSSSSAFFLCPKERALRFEITYLNTLNAVSARAVFLAWHPCISLQQTNSSFRVLLLLKCTLIFPEKDF